MVVQSDGKIIIGGAFGYVSAAGDKRVNIARFNADGSLDTAFDFRTSSTVNALAIVGNTLYLGGSFTGVNNGGTSLLCSRLTGPSLTNGAVGATATRNAAAIKTYLDDNRPKFDIDGDGSADARTDGLLTLRYLFGLRGASLIAAAVNPAGIRPTAPAIEAYANAAAVAASAPRSSPNNDRGCNASVADND